MPNQILFFGVVGAPAISTYVTIADETIDLPNSQQHVNIALADRHPPATHASTHATGGTDAIAPADIGAIRNAGNTPEILADIATNRPAAGVAGRLFWETNTKRLYRDSGTAWEELQYILIPAGSVQGDILFHDGATWTRLAAGTAGQYLQTQGTGANPQWVDVVPGLELWNLQFYWLTLFESIDGYLKSTSGTGKINLTGLYLELSTGTTSGSVAYLRRKYTYSTFTTTWDKNRKIRTKLYVSSNSAQTVWVISGERGKYRHIGFKIVDNTLYGTVGDGTAESTLAIMSFLSGAEMILEAVLTAGTQCEFFVDGVSQGTLTTNLPTGTGFALDLIHVYITNTAAANKSIRLNCWEFLQDR